MITQSTGSVTVSVFIRLILKTKHSVNQCGVRVCGHKNNTIYIYMIRENVSLLQTADRPRQCDRDRRKIGVNTVVQFPCRNTQVELPLSGPYALTYSTAAF